jgi:hypothetical protein
MYAQAYFLFHSIYYDLVLHVVINKIHPLFPPLLFPLYSVSAFRFLWVSSLTYPSLLGTKRLVVVVALCLKNKYILSYYIADLIHAIFVTVLLDIITFDFMYICNEVLSFRYKIWRIG